MDSEDKYIGADRMTRKNMRVAKYYGEVGGVAQLTGKPKPLPIAHDGWIEGMPGYSGRLFGQLLRINSRDFTFMAGHTQEMFLNATEEYNFHYDFKNKVWYINKKFYTAKR